MVSDARPKVTRMGAPASPLPSLRSDARRNRDRIVEVARELFAQRGLAVPMASIARRAGIGTATLYRRFPTKDELVTAVFAEQFATCVAAVEDALSDPDPWRGFRMMIADVCVLQARERGFGAAFLASFPDAGTIGEDRARAVRGYTELVARAQAAGRLRPDFVPSDMSLIVASVAGLVELYPRTAEANARRLVGYFLAAFAADHDGPPLSPSPLTLPEVFETTCT